MRSSIYYSTCPLFQIVNYYQFKEDHPELFNNIFPLDLQTIGDANVIAVPPYRDQDGRRLMIFRIGELTAVTLVDQALEVGPQAPALFSGKSIVAIG